MHPTPAYSPRFIGLIFCLLFSLYANHAMASDDAIIRFFPSNSLATFVGRNAIDFLSNAETLNASLGQPSLYSLFWRENRSYFRRRMGITQPPKDWRDFFSFIGLSPRSRIGVALVGSTHIYPLGALVVLESSEFKLTETYLKQMLSSEIVRTGFSICMQNIRNYRSARLRMQQRGHQGPFSRSRLERHHPNLHPHACPSGGQLQMGKQIHCSVHKAHGGSYWSWTKKWRQLLKDGLPQKKIRGGWLIGSKKMGFQYALLNKRYLVFSTHPKLLQMSLQQRHQPNPLRKGYRRLNPKSHLHGHIAYARASRWLNTLVNNSPREFSMGRQELMAFRALFSSHQGIKDAWFSGHLGRKRLRVSAITSRQKQGLFSHFLNTKPQQLQSLRFLPARSSLVFAHNLNQPLLIVAAQIMRNLSRAPSMMMMRSIAMMVDSWRLILGKEMALGLFPNRRSAFAAALAIQIKDPKMVTQQLNDLQMMFGKNRKLFQSTRIGRLVIHHTDRYHRRRSRTPQAPHSPTPKRVREEIAFVVLGKYLLITYQDRAVPLALIRKLLRLSQRGHKKTPTFQRLVRSMGRSNVFSFASFETLRKAMQGRRWKRSTRELLKATSIIKDLFIRVKNQGKNTHFRGIVRFQKTPLRNP